ncbi:MAG: hypothetical protein WCO23_02000 [bacterium]
MINRLVVQKIALAVYILSLMLYPFNIARAGVLADVSVAASSDRPVSSSTHFLAFKINTTSTIKQISLQYGKTVANQTKPTNLEVGDAVLGNIVGLNTSWLLDKTSASVGQLSLTNSDGESKTSGDGVSFELSSIINPAIGDCSTTDSKIDFCFLSILTYSDAGQTLVDSGNANYTIHAGELSDMSATIDPVNPLTTSSHTISFTPNTTKKIKQIDFQYGKKTGNELKPASLRLTSAELSIDDGLTPSLWALDALSAGTGLLKLASVEGQDLGPSNPISITFTGIYNPEIGECSSSHSLMDSCAIFIKTYSDAGTLLTDYGQVNYEMRDDVSLSFAIEGVSSGVATNGMTTTTATDSDMINFGRLDMLTPKLAAQKLTISTTAPNGYRVSVKTDGYLQGLFPANKIDPFGDYNVAWNAPKVWTHPWGTEPNSDTAWFGANTSDARIDSCLGLYNVWSNGYGSAKYGPISTTRHAVMCSEQKDYGTSAYVTYNIEVSEIQPPDTYIGTIVYDVLPVY